eukprot:1394766-Amorphochlora_amoeboformis.AAC.1
MSRLGLGSVFRYKIWIKDNVKIRIRANGLGLRLGLSLRWARVQLELELTLLHTKIPVTLYP